MVMRTHNDIIKAFGGPTKFARVVGVTPMHASLMGRRNSIPPEYWPRVVAASAVAEAPLARGVTAELLSTLRPPRKQRPQKGAATVRPSEAA